MQVPNKLKKGDTIGVIAPSGIIRDCDINKINESVRLLEEYGFNVLFAKNCYEDDWGYSASAKKRADDINEMFSNKEVKAIIAATGGYNSSSVFDYLDFEMIKNNPKILCGFSDTTSIENVISDKCDFVTYSGTTLKAMTSWDTDYAFKQFIKKFVNGDNNLFEKDEECFVINDGIAEGELVGGNLSLIARLCSGVYQIDFDNKILFIEDLVEESPVEVVCENLYKLKQNGVFDIISGIWIGNYDGEVPMEKILFDVLDNNPKFPIIKSENFGHIDKKMVIPIGIRARIDTNKNTKIKLLEPMCK